MFWCGQGPAILAREVQELRFAGTDAAGPDDVFSVAAGLRFQAAAICGGGLAVLPVPIPFLSLGLGAADPRRDPRRISRAFRSRFCRRSVTERLWRFWHGDGVSLVSHCGVSGRAGAAAQRI